MITCLKLTDVASSSEFLELATNTMKYFAQGAGSLISLVKYGWLALISWVWDKISAWAFWLGEAAWRQQQAIT